jgi:hypothetical protein
MLLELARNRKRKRGVSCAFGHAARPGTPVTLEIQETSDVVNMFTPPAGSGPKSKDLLWKDVDPELRAKNNFNVLLDLVNWKVTADPHYYEHYHLTPIPFEITPEGEESWIFYGTRKFSGKKTVVKPASGFGFQEKGPFTLFRKCAQHSLKTMLC